MPPIGPPIRLILLHLFITLVFGCMPSPLSFGTLTSVKMGPPMVIVTRLLIFMWCGAPIWTSALTPPGTPPPAFTCVDHGMKRQFVNDTCKTDRDCGSSNMRCANGLCSCAEHSAADPVHPSNNTRYTCVQLPYLHQPCSDQCRKPLTCLPANSGTNTSFPPGQFMLPRPASHGRRCTCAPPAVYKDGLCFLECPKDEYYKDGQCRKQCSTEEVKMTDGSCMKRVSLGEACEDTRQCSAAYSQCSSGACQCKSGFSNNNGKCESKNYTCPLGEPISANGAVVSCKIVKSPNALRPIPSSESTGVGPPQAVPLSLYQLADTCGDGQFCAVEGGGSHAEGAAGHCCPSAKPQCPIGAPHPNATCGLVTKENPDRCPFETHFCSYGPGHDGVCCPLACPPGFQLVDGQCFSQSQHGEACRVDEQCRGHNGVCQSGACACRPNAVAQGNPMYKYCRLQCPPNQTVINNECHDRLELGDQCNDTLLQCPVNAQCSAQGVCACMCGYQAIGERICGHPPRCGSIEARPMPTPVESNMVIREATNNETESQDGKPSSSLQTFTYCKVSPGAPSPLPSAVDQCPDGETCSYYLHDLGVCCPTPKPFCPPGQIQQDQKCDPRTRCSGGHCFRYHTPANSTDYSVGFICCSGQIPMQPVTGAEGGERSLVM